MGLKLLLSPLLLFFVLKTVSSVQVICYYASWTAYQGITPELLDAKLCTHFNYAFVGITADGSLKLLDQELEINKGLLKKVTDLKQRNPKLKVLLSVGGASEEYTKLFSAISSDAAKRKTFVGSASHFLTTYKFDGLDIDWEYPAAADKGNYIALLKEVKAAFKPKKWLLTAAVSSSPKDGYDVKEMVRYLDFINLMTYDFYGGWSSYTGQNSPLHPSSVESAWEKANLNILGAAKNWEAAGAPRSKVAIGTGSYGRSFTLKDPNQHGLHAPISGAGSDGGTATYTKICTSYAGWTRVWDKQQKNPYKYHGDQWIGYDDKESISAKGKWIKFQGYFGAMMWTVDGDDVKGQCGEKQILLKELNRSLK